MKRFFLIFLVMCCFLSCHGQNIQVHTMEEVFKHLENADDKTLAIFDVDMVLIQPSDPAFQMSNMKQFKPISRRIMQEMPQEKIMMFLCFMTNSSNSILIDQTTPELFKTLAKRGIPAMALTAYLTGELGHIKSLETWRIEELNRHGIDFSTTAPHPTPFVLHELPSYRGYHPTYERGILFANGTVSKGDALLAFLEKTGCCPNKIIFVDDIEANLKSVKEALMTLDRPIEYIAIHYLGALKYPSKTISEKEFEARWQQVASHVMLLP